MEPVVRAIDVGYGITKYVLSAERGQVRCAHFSSIAPVTIGRDLAAALGRQRKTVEIPIGGLSYEVGPDARLADDVFSTRNMDNDFVRSPEYLALARGAMHYMRVPRIDLLVVGLPVSTFALQKTVLEKRLTGMHDLGGGRNVKVRKVRVLAHAIRLPPHRQRSESRAAIRALSPALIWTSGQQPIPSPSRGQVSTRQQTRNRCA